MHATTLRVAGGLDKTVVELADSHTHLDLISDASIISDAVKLGVSTIITDGVDTRSNARALELSDGKHVFAALGVDPHHAVGMGPDELAFNIGIIHGNASRIVAIGEIGLEYVPSSPPAAIKKQKAVFTRFIELAMRLGLPVSVHARGAISDVIAILEESGMQKVHLHFFEGDVIQARAAERLGFMISIPPLESNKRKRVMRDVSLDRLMAETDSPVVGKTPRDVERSIRLIAEAKGLSFEKVAEAVTANTKKFFNIHGEKGFMRY